jgi:dTDP-4-dehydrorhamnose reductase
MILATGAKGMLGMYFNSGEVLKTDIDDLDIKNLEALHDKFNEVKPDIVLHLGAETDVDLCEKNPDHAFRTNALGTMNVALACQKFNCIMAYISTAAVFPGEKDEPYTEFDLPNPQTVYSKSKYQGELIVRELLNRHYIFRAGWMMGGNSKDKKFVGKIWKIMKERDTLDVVSDKFGSPTYTKDLARGVMQMIKTGLYGTYHMVNNGVCSRYEMAVEIVRVAGLKVKINPCSSDKFPLPAPRAKTEAARNYKLELLGMNMMRDWRVALKEYVQTELK